MAIRQLRKHLLEVYISGIIQYAYTRTRRAEIETRLMKKTVLFIEIHFSTLFVVKRQRLG